MDRNTTRSLFEARSNIHSRVWAAAMAGLLIGAAGAADEPTAASSDAYHSKVVPLGGQLIKGGVLPRGLAEAGPVTVVMVMSEDPIAAVRGRAVDHSITASERQAVIARIAAQHASIQPAIEARGGTVLARG